MSETSNPRNINPGLDRANHSRCEFPMVVASQLSHFFATCRADHYAVGMTRAMPDVARETPPFQNATRYFVSLTHRQARSQHLFSRIESLSNSFQCLVLHPR